MQIYLAPMEELTGYVYRNVYQNMFGDIDKYYTPFVSPTKKKVLKTREQKDVDPAHNQNGYTVPQILTNDISGFMDTVYYLLELGYQEINLNVGCPSATVVSKGKGAGMLKDPDDLDSFFQIIFDTIYKEGLDNVLDISVKSRLGLEEEYEWEDILKVYNRYPISELILHPRFQKEFYSGQVHLDLFQRTLENSLHPVCYNGDIFTVEDYILLMNRFPSIDRIMLGRGVLSNPTLPKQIQTWEETKNLKATWEARLDEKMLEDYYQKLYRDYVSELGSEKDAIFKCKELWYYLTLPLLHPSCYYYNEIALKEITRSGEGIERIKSDEDVQDSMNTNKTSSDDMQKNKIPQDSTYKYILKKNEINRNYLNIKKSKNEDSYRTAVNKFWSDLKE